MAANKNFIVAYDLHGATSQDYKNVEDAITKCGATVVNSQGSASWVGGSPYTAKQIRDAVMAASGNKATRVWVTEIGSDVSYFPESNK